MKIIQTELENVLVIEPRVFGDERGFFLETFQAERYRASGIDYEFVQDNLSCSRRGVLRGLHLQNPRQQGKLVYVLKGEVYDVVVDVRLGSPTFGRWICRVLNDRNKHQIWVPPGFAHGFCVLSDTVLFAYKCTDYYSPEDEITVRWDDPVLSIDWPTTEVSLSEKDASAPCLADIDPGRLPRLVK